MKPSVCPCQIPFRLHGVMFPPTPASVVISYHRALCEMSTEPGMLIVILSALPPSADGTFCDSGVSTPTRRMSRSLRDQTKRRNPGTHQEILRGFCDWLLRPWTTSHTSTPQWHKAGHDPKLEQVMILLLYVSGWCYTMGSNVTDREILTSLTSNGYWDDDIWSIHLRFVGSPHMTGHMGCSRGLWRPLNKTMRVRQNKELLSAQFPDSVFS